MANLNNSWEASVVKLAQSGNLKAITFWLNRYLVPQGLCAQVIAEQPGALLIRVVCHRLPDGHRLIQFIRQRFLELNSEVILTLRITAQMVGSAQILWDQAIPIRFTGSTQTQSTQTQPQAPSAPIPSQALSPVSSQAQVSSKTQSAQIQFTPRLIPRNPAAQSSASRPASKKYKTQKPSKKRVKHPGFAPAYRSMKSSRRSSAVKIQTVLQSWTVATCNGLDDLKFATLRTTRRSQQWFRQRSPETRAMLVGGSVATGIAVICGLQVLTQQLSGSSGGLWEAAMTENNKPHVDQSGTVQAALEHVPVIRQPVQDLTDPTVTLVFASNAALGQPGSIAAYQQADLLMSNLDNSLAPPSPVASPQPSAGAQSLSAHSSAILKTLLGKAQTTATAPTATTTPAELSSEDERLETDTSTTVVKDSASLLVSSAGYLSVPLESSSSDAEEGEISLKPAHQTTLETLSANGVDLVNVATERLMAENANLPQTLDLLSQKAVYAVGAGHDQRDARRPRIFEIKGQKIAFLAYSDSDVSAAGKQSAGINPAINQQVEADIKAVRDQVNWVIVSYHWTKVTRSYPEETQINLARAAIDHGADMVVGYAPQITQGAEVYSGRPIVYSLGDTTDDEYSDTSSGNYHAAALKVTLNDRTMQVEFLPIQVNQNQPTLAEGEAQTKVTRYLQQASSLFDHPLRSPLTLDARLRVSLPTAPDAELPTDPFVTYPKPSSKP